MPNQGHLEAGIRFFSLLPSKVGWVTDGTRNLWAQEALLTKASSPGYFRTRDLCSEVFDAHLLIPNEWATKLVFTDIWPVKTGPFRRLSNLLWGLQLSTVWSNQGKRSPSPLLSLSVLSVSRPQLVELDDIGFAAVHLGFSFTEIR